MADDDDAAAAELAAGVIDDDEDGVDVDFGAAMPPLGLLVLPAGSNDEAGVDNDGALVFSKRPICWLSEIFVRSFARSPA